MKTVTQKVFSIATFIFAISISLVDAQTIGDFRTRNNGNWNNIATWSRWNGTSWVDATTGQLPTPQSNVQISNNHSVNFNIASLTINTLTFESGDRDCNLQILSTNSLTVSGQINIGAALRNNDVKALLVDAGTVTCSGLTLATTSNDSRDLLVRITTGTLNVSGNLTMNGISDRNQILFLDNGFLNLGGSITGGTLNTSLGTLGTVNYNGSAAQTINLSYIYNDLNINNTDVNGASISGPITASNVLGAIRVGNQNIRSVFRTQNNNITRGNSSSIVVSSGSTMNAGSTNINFGSTGTMQIDGTFIFTDPQGLIGAGAAISNANNPTVTIGSNSTIDYAGEAQAVQILSSYGNLTFSGTGLKTFGSGNLKIPGTFTIEGNATTFVPDGLIYEVGNFKLGATNQPAGVYSGTSITAPTNHVVGTRSITVRDVTTVLGSTTSGIIVSNAAALPVTLSSFTAKPSTDNKVALAWVTSSESVNKGFSIERQEEGSGKFQSLGFIASKAEGGNSQTTLAYSFKDVTAKNGINMYRLVQEDLDGTKTYSEVRVVKLSGQSVSNVFPNPSTGAINISRTNDGKKMNVQVLDQSGRVISQVNNITDANYRMNLPQSGIYSIKMMYPETGEQSIQRVVVQK
jgi:hypothetical protein